MRIGKVIGRVVLTQTYDTLVGGRFLLVEVQDRFSLVGQAAEEHARRWSCTTTSARRDGDLIAFTESREATHAVLSGEARAAGRVQRGDSGSRSDQLRFERRS